MKPVFWPLKTTAIVFTQFFKWKIIFALSFLKLFAMVKLTIYAVKSSINIYKPLFLWIIFFTKHKLKNIQSIRYNRESLSGLTWLNTRISKTSPLFVTMTFLFLQKLLIQHIIVFSWYDFCNWWKKTLVAIPLKASFIKKMIRNKTILFFYAW